MKNFISFLIGILFAGLLAAPVVFAEGNLGNALGNLGTAGKQAGTDTTTDVASVVGTLINGALTLVGTIFFVLMVYAGYMWLTSRGEEEKIEKSKDIIKASIIGLIVVLSAYAITVFVTKRFETGTGCVNLNPYPPACNVTCSGFTQADCSVSGGGAGCCTWVP